jgi:deoxyribodipyrimidine photo-lyase
MTQAPLILWFRRDLRLADHPMLAEAAATGRPLVPVFVLDPETDSIGAAAKWRLGLAVQAFSDRLQTLGQRLTLRRGAALRVLERLVAETGASGVWWSRLYDNAARARDGAVKTALREAGHEARSFPGHLLHEPWEVMTGQGGLYRVYTPFWNAVRGRGVPTPDPAPETLRPPEIWPESEALPDWRLGQAMQRGALVVRPWQRVGEAAARDRLAHFLDGPVDTYAEMRNRMDIDGGSGLSENLTYGEIGIREVWHCGLRALHEGRGGAERFLMELVWRDFAWHLMFHFPDLARRNWRPEWDSFPWRGDNPDAERWRRGLTGEPAVDAAMREMYVTGKMHNRARMLAASYLTKHLLTDWRVGLKWFADCLTDWDAASNAMGWQWVAGSGPDAAPYFRIFNPATQSKTYDPHGTWRDRWLGRGSEARSYFDVVPRRWNLSPDSPPPPPLVGLAQGRARALEAWQQRKP